MPTSTSPISEAYEKVPRSLLSSQDTIPPQNKTLAKKILIPNWHSFEDATIETSTYLQAISANNYAVMGRGTDYLRDNQPYILSQNRRLQSVEALRSINNFKDISIIRGAAALKYGIGTNGEILEVGSTMSYQNEETIIRLQGGTLSSAFVGLQHTGTNQSNNINYQVNAVYKRNEEFSFSENTLLSSGIQSSITIPTIASDGYIDTESEGRVVATTDGVFANDYEDILTDFKVNWSPSNDLNITLLGGFNQTEGLVFQHIGESYLSATELWGGVLMKAHGVDATINFSNYANDKGSTPSYAYRSGFTTALSNQTLNASLSYTDSLDFLGLNWIGGVNYEQINTDSKNQVFGRNEAEDDYANYGGFLEAALDINDQLSVLLATRYDYISAIEQSDLSYGATINYQLQKQHTIGANYTKSIQPPSPFTLYADLPIASNNLYDVWLSGNAVAQNFSNTPLITWGDTDFYSTPYVAGFSLTSAYLSVLEDGKEVLKELITPLIDGRRLWGALNFVLIEEFAPVAFANNFTSEDLFSETNDTKLPVGAIAAKLPYQEVMELSYEGLLLNKLQVNVGAYHIRQANISQLALLSPVVTLQSLGSELGEAVRIKIQPEFEELLFEAGGFSKEGAASKATEIGLLIKEVYTDEGNALLESFNGLGLPFHGIVTTNQTTRLDIPQLMAGYQTLGEINYWGVDFSFKYDLTKSVNIFGSYFWLSSNKFEPLIQDSDTTTPYYLNRPENRINFGFQYQNVTGLNGQVLYKYESAFESLYGFRTGIVGKKNLIDVSIGYNFKNNLSIGLSVTNLLNNQYHALPTLPLISRRVLGGIQYQF